MPNSRDIGILKVPVQADLAPFEKAAKQDLRQRANQYGKAAAAELGAALKAGAGKAGKDASDAVIAKLRENFKRKINEAREELARGLIDRKQFEQRGREAGEAFNRGILKQLDKLVASGKITNEQYMKLTSQLKQVDRVGAQTTNNLREGFTRVLTVVGALYLSERLITFLRRVGEGVRDLITHAGSVKQIETSFTNLAAAAGESGDELLTSMRKATRGTVSDLKLMTNANLVLTSGIPVTAEAMGRLAEVARRLGRAVGRDANESFQRLATGIAKGEQNILEELGLLTRLESAVNDWARANGRNADSLTQQEKILIFFNAVMAEAEKKVAAMGEEAHEAGTPVQQLTTFVTNLKDALAIAIADSPPVLSFLDQIGVRAENSAGSVQRLANVVGALIDTAAGRVEDTFTSVPGRMVVGNAKAQGRALKGLAGGLARNLGIDPDAFKANLRRREIQTESNVLRLMEMQVQNLERLNQLKDQGAKVTDKEFQSLMRENQLISDRVAILRKKPEKKDQTETPGGLTPEQLAEQERLNKEAQKLLDKWMESTRFSSEQRLHELQQFEAAAKRLGDAGALRDIRIEMGKARKEIEAVENAGKISLDFLNVASVSMPRLLRAVPDATSMAAPALARYEATVAKLKEQLARGLISDSEFAQKEKEAATRLNQQLFRILDSLRAMGALTDYEHQAIVGMLRDGAEEGSKLSDQLDKIVSSARGLLSVADAFGDISDETRRALEGVVGIAEGIRSIAQGDKIGGAIQIFGGLGQLFRGVFGESQAERERRQIIEENTAALRAMALELAGFRMTASVVGNARRALGGVVSDPSLGLVLSRGGDAGQTAVIRQLTADLTKFGLSLEELDAIAEEQGIEIRHNGRLTADGLTQLYEALQLAEQALVGFRETVDDQRTAAATRADIFDEPDDPQSGFIRELNLLHKFAPGLFARAGAFDPTTAQGRAAVEAMVRQLFTEFEAGTLNLEGLTREEFLELLGNIEGFLDDLGQSAPGAPATSFQVSRSITEVTGNRLAGLLTTDVHWNEITARHTEHIAALLDRYMGAQVSVPSPSDVSRNFGVVAPSVVFSPHISIPIALEHSSIRPGEERAVAQEIGNEVSTIVNRRLGAEMRSMLRAMGKV